MEANDLVSHLCTPRYNHPTPTTSTTTTNNDSGRRRSKRKRSRKLTRSKSQHDVTGGRADHKLYPNTDTPHNDNLELSLDHRAPGLLKIFGESVVAGTRYKSVLASTRSTAQELIKQALERYGISSGFYLHFVLCESVGRTVLADDRGGFRCDGADNGHRNPEDKKKLITTSSSQSSSSVIVGQSSSLSSNSGNQSCKNTTRSLQGKKLKKLLYDQSPCGSPRVYCDSPRTPLGSPRTPCGSPSTSRGSPRTSLVCHSNGFQSTQEEFDLTNYRPPKVFDSCINYNNNHHHHHLHHQNRLISKLDKNRSIDSPRNNNNFHLDSSRHANDNVPSSGQDDEARLQKGVNHQTVGDWIQVYFRVLCDSDRPLELQEYWKPPEGLSRRYELKRRRDVKMEAMENETTGLNENARKIMISKILPGVIPLSEAREKSPEVRTTLREEWNRAASALTNASLTLTDDQDPVVADTRQAYVCPSIYPYLLTLRGCSIQKDLVLYPLKSRSLSIGSEDKKHPNDDIKLTSHDVNASHCRVTLKRLPQDEDSVEESKMVYWYCLDLEIWGNSFVTVNGIQVKQKATVFPGDLLGIGRQYLFLYKDPTGGHDIPSAVPWLPENEMEASAIYSQVIRHHQNESRDYSPLSNHQPRSDAIHSQNLDTLSTPYHEDDSNVLDDSTTRDTAIFLAYHRDKEMEMLECIAEVDCHAKGDYPLSQALLFLASHQYATRKFSGSHQATFFKRLVRVVRARVGAVSKLLSQQKHESRIFNLDNSNKKSSSSSSDVDYFPCLVNWLSTVLTLQGHCRTSQFQTFVSSLSRRSDVTKSVQEAVVYFEETISFLFQQVVYSVTKVLYDPINKFMQGAVPDNPQSSSDEALRRILDVLQAVRRLVVDLLVKTEVANQLMVYLLFFVSTTLFNRIIAKGSRLYNRDSGTILHDGVSLLESWAKDSGLEHDFVKVSEHILSLVDLLSSSKRTLMRLDWQSFQTQFSPLSDLQLSKVLGEYDVGKGVTAPVAWQPSYPVDPKQGELTVSLSSHPPFVLSKQGEQVNLQDTSFPAAFYRHLEQLQQRFSLVGEDAYYSGLSSAGNTPRLSEPVHPSANLETFFSQDPNASISGWSSHSRSAKPQIVPVKARMTDDQHHLCPSNQTRRRVPPQTAPKPKRPLLATHTNDTTTTNNRTSAPPPYNMAIRLKQEQSIENASKTTNSNNNTDSTDSSKRPHSSRTQNPPLPHQNSTDQEPNESNPKSNSLFQSDFHKFQTLPDNVKDKLFSSSSNNSISHSNLKPNSNHSQSRSSGNSATHGSRGESSGKPGSHRLKSQQSWTPASNHSTAPYVINQSDLSSTYPVTRPRPSSVTDIQRSTECSHNPEDDAHATSGPFMSHHQRAELLSTRSNSALGYDTRNAGHHNHNTRVDSKTLQHRQNSVHRSDPGCQTADRGDHISHGPNYEHVKDSKIVSTQHMTPYNYTLHTNNIAHGHDDNVDINKDSGLFSYGSLKRSPRNTNLSKRTPSEIKLTNTTAPDRRVLVQSGQNIISNDPDIPPPLPPRGENIPRQNSVESYGHRDSSRERRNRESPLGSALSSSGHRPRAGSRTSVEIQDMTENQYIIYNPDSPVKEFFDFNQNYQSMTNKNNSQKPENQRTLCNQHNSQQESTRKLTRVPPLELPDDLLGGVSENDSQDDVFNGHFGSSDHAHSGSVAMATKPRRMSSLDDYPDDVYIDVNDLNNSDSTSSSNLKVLPVREDGRNITNDVANGTVFVRYRHSMPGVHDVISQQGEITGEVFAVTLTKTGNKLGMGLIDGLHTPLKVAGIYIRNVLPDTPAALCGCLRVGDRIVSVNNKTILDMDYNSAMKLIHDTGPRLELTVVKGDRSIASKISASTA